MSAAVARRLAEAGLDAASIVIALEAFEAVEEERRAAKREGNKERQARRRHAMSRDVTRDEALPSVTERDTPCPLPSSPQTPQQPTPTPESNTRTRKAEPSKADLTERIWQAASKVSRARSGRPALGKAVLAAIRLGATDEALLASVRDHCREQGEFAKGVHLIVIGEHWRDCGARPAASGEPPDPALIAHRRTHFAKTGEWKETWGPRPALDTPSQGQAA